MHRTLTPNRRKLVRTLQADGLLGVRALARRLGRDVRNIHDDLSRMKEIGMVLQGRDRKVRVPCDEIRVEIVIRKVA